MLGLDEENVSDACSRPCNAQGIAARSLTGDSDGEDNILF